MDTESRDSWVRLGKVGTESDGFWTKDFDANTEFRHSAFSRAVSAVRPFEVREGMEWEHTPETDLIRRHEDLEKGERFESSDLSLERCFLASCFRTTASPQASVNHGRKEG